MVLRTDSRALRTLGATASGFALLLAATGCSSTGSADESSSAPATQESSAAAASSSAPGGSSAATSASETAPPASSSKATKPAAAQGETTLDTVQNQEHKIAVVSTSKSTQGEDSLNTKLIIADHGCFHAVNQEGAPTLLVFPKGTTLNDHGKPTVTVDGSSIRVGERVDFTGQKIELSKEQASQASPCRAQGDVFEVAAAK